ncbi:MAG: hypothetical protein JW839_18385 [Candidatus Lokiarchaeota archaeon]|nr:hypothetical protein [Candidatus Lokiarchaeota archaeon]
MADERVQVLIAGEPFIHCRFLIARVSPTDADVSSIDDLARKRKAKKFEYGGIRRYLTIEEEVFAHASNIQAWADNDYDTRLLHSNISFPLLKALAEIGDAKANRVLGSEITDRIHEGNASTVAFILETFPELIDLDTLMELTREAPKDKLPMIWTIIGNRLLQTQPADAHKAFQRALLINDITATRGKAFVGIIQAKESQVKPSSRGSKRWKDITELRNIG